MIVYHRMPKNLVGATLHPLNTLKTVHPDVYRQHIEKYRGREQLSARRIPGLNCSWHDVLFFSNVHPAAIRDGFIAAGQRWRPRQWAVVDTVVAGFSGQNSVIYDPDPARPFGDFAAASERFAPFEPGAVDVIHELPPHALTSFIEAAARGEPLFAWRGLPHILLRGSIALADVQLLTL